MANEQEQQLGKAQVDSPDTPVQNVLDGDAASTILDGVAKTNEPVFQANNAQGANQQVIDNTQKPPVQQDGQNQETQTPPVDGEQAPVEQEYFVELQNGEKYSVPKEMYEHITTLRTNTESLANQAAAVEEFQKNPNEFLTKYAPHIILKQFDQNAYVKTKLNEEFGAEFNFDYTKAYEVGSVDYNYRIRQDELVNEARQLVNGAQNSIAQQEQEAKNTYTAATEAARIKLGVDENTWKTQVLSVIESAKQEEIIELIGRSILIKNNSAEYKANLEKAAQVASQVTPTSAMSGASTNQTQTQNTDKQKMSGLFGQADVNKAYASISSVN